MFGSLDGGLNLTDGGQGCHRLWLGYRMGLGVFGPIDVRLRGNKDT